MLPEHDPEVEDSSSDPSSPVARQPLDLRIVGDVSTYLTNLQTVIASLPREPLAQLTAELVRACQDGRTVFVLGNGGSAATASHMACDLAKTAAVAGAPRLRAVALTDNMPLVTAIGNDIGYDRVFSEQLRIFARPGDLAIMISASGNSPNVLLAAEVARELGVMVVGVTGFGGGRLHAMSDLSLVVESSEYGPVEDAHMIVVHTITMALRAATQRATQRATEHQAEREQTAQRASAASAASAATTETAPVVSAVPTWMPTASAPLTVFVDRDGVINRNSDDYIKRWSEFEFLPGALDALARLRRAGHRVFVVTNQACIAKGLTTLEEVDDLHQRMRQAVADAGGAIEDVLVCPHHPNDRCGCRKPEPGLIWQARDRYGLDLTRAVFVGDGATDMVLARRAGIPSVLVLSGLGWPTATALSPRALRACRLALSLDHAAHMLLGEQARAAANVEDEVMLRMLVRRARAGQWVAARQRTRDLARARHVASPRDPQPVQTTRAARRARQGT